MPTFRDNDGKGTPMDPNDYADILGEFEQRNRLNLRFSGMSHTSGSNMNEPLSIHGLDEDEEEVDGVLTMDAIQDILNDEEAEFTMTLTDEDDNDVDFSLQGLLETEDNAYLVLFNDDDEEAIQILFARCDEQPDGTIELEIVDDPDELERVSQAFEDTQSDEAESVITFNYINDDGEPDELQLMNVLEDGDKQYGVMGHEEPDGGMEIMLVHYWEDENGIPQISDIEDDDEYDRVDQLYEESIRNATEDDEEE